MDGSADTASPQEIDEDKGGDARERSSIGFPYIPLDDAIEVSSQIQSNVGSGVMSDDQLAPSLGLSPKSSGYRTRLSAARLFALIESADGGHRLSDLGKRIVDTKQERAARCDAFLNIPLYRRVYEEHKGGTIPPAAALEREFSQFGVAAKQTARARQVFDRSAEQANFFEHGRDRLVKPTVKQGEAGADEADKDKDSGGGAGGGGGNGGGGTGDPLLDALISKLPKSGTKWGADERIAWLTMMAMGFQITYGVEAAINITKGAGGPPPS